MYCTCIKLTEQQIPDRKNIKNKKFNKVISNDKLQDEKA